MSHGRNGKVKAERDCVNFSKISWVINDKMELGLESLSYPGGMCYPFLELGVPPQVSGWSGLKMSLLARPLSLLLFGRCWTIKNTPPIINFSFLLRKSICRIQRI